MNATNSNVDFVITWVDGSDPAWLESKSQHANEDTGTDSKDHRYRDWGLLKYWFRSVEQNAPWVRKIHLITCGQIPEWIDPTNPKLHLVNHSDYIPSEYLPTFSSHPIELNMHRIDGLADRFVYFNDDMFIGAPVQPESFFLDGQPVDLAALNVHCYSLEDTTQLYAVRAAGVINKYYNMREVLKRDMWKWYNAKAGQYLARTLVLSRCPRFPGFFIHHCAQPYLKKTFEELWQLEPELLHTTCTHKFRDVLDINPWLMKDWQLASGCFVPNSANLYGYYYIDGVATANQASKIIASKKLPHLCVNDSKLLSYDDFRTAAKIIRTSFDVAYSTPSSFERSV